MSNKPKIQTLKSSLKVADLRPTSTQVVNRIRGYKLNQIRQRIASRDEYTCRKCKRVTVDFEIDHIRPLEQGGAESDDNRQLLCIRCHKEKSAQEGEKR